MRRPFGLSSRPFRGVDVAVGVDGYALACRALIYPVVAFERRDEPGDEVLVDRADSDTVTSGGYMDSTQIRSRRPSPLRGGNPGAAVDSGSSTSAFRCIE